MVAAAQLPDRLTGLVGAITGGYVTIVAFEAVALPRTALYLFPELNQVRLWSVAGSDGADGEGQATVAFGERESFFANFLRLLGEPVRPAEVMFLEPILPANTEGRRRIADVSRERIVAAVQGGFLSVVGDKVTVLADYAIFADEIDSEVAKSNLDNEDRVLQARSEAELAAVRRNEQK